MPRTDSRVVCGLGETIESLTPRSAFISVDLPTLGQPTMATYPERKFGGRGLDREEFPECRAQVTREKLFGRRLEILMRVRRFADHIFGALMGRGQILGAVTGFTPRR